MLRAEKKKSMSYRVVFQREKNLRTDTIRHREETLDLAPLGHHR